jgi:hypothetical protein
VIPANLSNMNAFGGQSAFTIRLIGINAANTDNSTT